MTPWIDYFIRSLPVVLVVLVYFVRLETRLAKINNDLYWIKKQLSRRRTDGQNREDVYANDSGS